MARKGKLASGFNVGIDPFFKPWSGVRLTLSRAEVDAALEESGSTADNSTADGVLLVDRAVAVTGFAATAA